MKICIIGWYGTETIGDRAILAGLIYLFGKVLKDFNISIGSLYPHFTQRTVLEDSDFYKEISNHRLTGISIFDSLNKKQLKENIHESDLLIIGGGPLMDIEPMHMLDYAFRYAKRHSIKTAVLGCGWGPLNNDEFKSVALSIVSNSDLTIFRDSTSLKQFQDCSAKFHCGEHECYYSIDPAFFCADYFKKIHPQESSGFIAVNFRDVSLDQYGGNEDENESFFKAVLTELSELSMPIHLVPMHTFHVGGDDRALLNRLYLSNKDLNIVVHNNPPSLVEVMQLYRDSDICVGMRFHSIVLQTILNGNNIILDYTDPQKGKIISMMRELDMEDRYKNRYYSLLNKSGDISFAIDSKFEVNEEYIRQREDVYIENLKVLLN